MKKQSIIISCITLSFLLFIMSSCKKDESALSKTPVPLKNISDVIHPKFDSTGSTGSGNGGNSQGASITAIDTALSKLNWTYYYQNHLYDSSINTTVTVNLPSGYNADNSRVYLIGTDKAITELWPAANINSFYIMHVNYSSGIYKALVIADINGVLYDTVQQVTINSGVSNNVTINSLQQMSSDNLVLTINNL